MTNVIHVDFKKDREELATLNKIKAETFNKETEE